MICLLIKINNTVISNTIVIMDRYIQVLISEINLISRGTSIRH